MLRDDDVPLHSYKFYSLLIQPGHHCFCYHWYGKFLLWFVFNFINIWYASTVRAHVLSHCITVAQKHLFDYWGEEDLNHYC